MKSISRTYALPGLRRYRHPDGRLTLQQQWCTQTNTLRELDDSPALRTPEPSEEYAWRDVPVDGLPVVTG